MITNNIFIAMKAKIIRIIKSHASEHKLIIVPAMEGIVPLATKKKKMCTVTKMF